MPKKPTQLGPIEQGFSEVMGTLVHDFQFESRKMVSKTYLNDLKKQRMKKKA